MVTVLCCLVVLCGLQAGDRPSQPDFTGEWVLVSPAAGPADVAATLTVRQPIVTQTARGTSMPAAYLTFFVQRHFSTGDLSETFWIGTEGGTVGSSTDARRVESRQSVKWVGNTLVIATSRWSGPQSGEPQLDSEREERWQIDPQGKLVLTVRESEGTREWRTTTLKYRRRE